MDWCWLQEEVEQEFLRFFQSRSWAHLTRSWGDMVKLHIFVEDISEEDISEEDISEEDISEEDISEEDISEEDISDE